MTADHTLILSLYSICPELAYGITMKNVFNYNFAPECIVYFSFD